jgi:hypothetical protein
MYAPYGSVGLVNLSLMHLLIQEIFLSLLLWKIYGFSVVSKPWQYGHFGVHVSLLRGAVQSILGCLAASLASAYLQQSKMQNDKSVGAGRRKPRLPVQSHFFIQQRF